MAIRVGFLKELLAHIPEDQRGTVEAALDTEAVQSLAANRIQEQANLSRAMDDVRAKTTALEEAQARVTETAAQQTAWYEANKAALEAARSGQPAPVPTPTTPTVPADVVRKADLETFLNERERGAVSFIAATNKLTFEHSRRFPNDPPLDIAALTADPDIAKLGLAGVYRKQFGEQLTALDKATDDARITAEVNKRVAEALKASGNRPPYPVPGSEVSPLDVLNAQHPDPSQFSVDAAADEYLRLAASRAS